MYSQNFYFKFQLSNMKHLFALKLILMVIISGHSQAKSEPKLKNPTIQYNVDRPWVEDTSGDAEKDSVQLLFNDKMLNILFADKVGTAFGGSNDLTLNKYFASLDEEDKSISIGINIDSRFGNETKKLTWLFTGSIKFKSANKFATIFDKDGVFQKDNIGATIKTTWIGRGIINFKDSKGKQREGAIKNFRKVNDKAFKDIVDKYNKDDLPKIKTNLEDARKYDSELKTLEETLKNKHDTLYIDLAKSEIKFLEENKMYHYLWDHWVSLEAFLPFGHNSYNLLSDPSLPISKEKIYAFNIKLSYNTMWQWSSGISLFLKGIATFKNNNNILINDIPSKVLQETLTGANGEVIINESTNVYITDYKDFETLSLKVEPAFFFISNNYLDLGLSPSIEFNFGEYNKTNWKLGVPISLKDKKGKPTVNFEFQWREINTLTSRVRTLGLSTNFLFGDLIN